MNNFINSIRFYLIRNFFIRFILYSFIFFLSFKVAFIYIDSGIVSKINNYSETELKESIQTGSYGFMSFVDKTVNFVFVDYFWLCFLGFSFFFFFFIYSSFNRINFICPHCLKAIYLSNIKNIECHLCKTNNHGKFSILLFCSSCKEIIDYFNCPHCHIPIDANKEYDVDLLKAKRRNLSVVKSSFVLGLRELYLRNKRLPMFICKHCKHTIIVKNINLTCPFCSADFVVTDNQKIAQLGDVKVKNFRNVIDESTMEGVLFNCCPVCGGKIPDIDCYHCHKEINLFESYNEKELEDSRYV